MEITVFNFCLISLAVFRLTRLIVFDKITAFLRSPFMMDYEVTNDDGEIETYLIPREHGIRGWIGELISCYWCTGIWVTLCLFFIQQAYPIVGNPLIIILAIAGVAALIEAVLHAIMTDAE